MNLPNKIFRFNFSKLKNFKKKGNCFYLTRTQCFTYSHMVRNNPETSSAQDDAALLPKHDSKGSFLDAQFVSRNHDLKFWRTKALSDGQGT